jgi:hypothetical protein
MQPQRIAKDDQGRSACQHGTLVDPGTDLSLYDLLSPLILNSQWDCLPGQVTNTFADIDYTFVRLMPCSTSLLPPFGGMVNHAGACTVWEKQTP